MAAVKRLKVCSKPGCPELTTSARCEAHTTQARAAQSTQRRRSGDEAMRAYSTAAWRRARRAQLTRSSHCATCGSRGQVVDHRIPRQILAAAGIAALDHKRWLQTLCERCHNTKTAAVDRPLLARLRAGEDPTTLAEAADLAATQGMRD